MASMVKIVVLLWLSLGLIGCTYDTYDTDQFYSAEEVGAEMEKTGGWSASGELVTGGGDGAGVNLQAVFPNAGNYTLQFSVQRGDTYIVRPTAEITWSVQGNSVNRLVSIGNGLSISGQAEGVSVRIYDSLTENLGFDHWLGLPYLVSMQVVPGTRPNVGQPPTYSPVSYIEENYNDASIETHDIGYTLAQVLKNRPIKILIPENAGAISFLAHFIWNAPIAGDEPDEFIPNHHILINQMTGAGYVLATYGHKDAIGFIPLIPGCTQIQIVNRSLMDVRTSFLFGIDG
jgi:hypothetical protein